MPDTTKKATKTKVPKGCQVEARLINAIDRVAFGFIYLPDDTRVGWSTNAEHNVELWIANWGEPNRHNIRAAQVAADYLCEQLPWEPSWAWKVN